MKSCCPKAAFTQTCTTANSANSMKPDNEAKESYDNKTPSIAKRGLLFVD